MAVTIEKDTIIGDVLDLAPETAPLFQAIGMHCLGCPASRGEAVKPSQQANISFAISAMDLSAQPSSLTLMK